MKGRYGGLVLAGLLVAATAAQAGLVTHTARHVFSVNDVQCDKGVFGIACLDMTSGAVGKDGFTYYPLDSAYGWNVKDFDPAGLVPRPMDGVYAEGKVANSVVNGVVSGLVVQNPKTANWKAGPLGGEWAMGLGALKAKTATEHYVVMEHLMQSPYLPALIKGVDYKVRQKDDGKALYYWGNYNKEPTPVYVYAKMPLPAAWKVPGANFKVVSAKLLVDHNITNSPNDQIRPEDFENEQASGILPRYTVGADGSWLSTVDSYEGGDGEFLPAGTVLRDAAGQYTNAWYTTLDRDPFGGPNPRYRLKSSKYGQDLPGVELPQYIPDTPTTTTLDLLSIKDEVTGLPVLAESKNWHNYLDQYSDHVTGQVLDPVDGYSINQCPLTPDFDLMMYIKGEVGKPTTVRNAQLVVVYEDDAAAAGNPVDVAITATSIPGLVFKNNTSIISVSVANQYSGAVPVTVTLVGRDKSGVVVGSFRSELVTSTNSSATAVSYSWKAPAYGTTVTWTATVAHPDDIVAGNNVKSATTVVKKLR